MGIIFPIVLQAQSLLCTYQGGYFIRDGNNWYEYRPESKNTVWANYTQNRSDDNFYYIKNSNDEVAIPKAKNNSIYIKRSGDWKVIYKTINIYNYCPERSTQFFTFDTGYFIKKNSHWTLILPHKKSNEVWATYDEYKVDENYYYIKNSYNSISIPRKTNSKFYIWENNDWKTLYDVQALYDANSPNAKSGYNYSGGSSSQSSVSRGSNNANSNSNSRNYSNVNTSKYYYWECSIAPDPYTGVTQFIRGDGTTRIKVTSSSGMLESIEENGQEYDVEYAGEENGYEIYDTPNSGKKIWVQGKYVFIVSIAFGKVFYTARYNPQKGVISGNQNDINRYDYNFGGESSSGSSSRSSRGSSSSSRSICSTCNGTKITPQQSSGGSHYTWVAYYNKEGNRCPYCNKFNEHFHNKCPSCNVPKY